MHWRILPQFAVIGTQKGGTTSLFSYLGQHPQILKTSVKEIHYFDLNYVKGVDWYKSHFATRWWKTIKSLVTGKPIITGEATPYYMFHPHAMQRLRRDFPSLPLIVMLRNPIDRAFSHYQHNSRHGWETISYERALATEDSRMEGVGAPVGSDEWYQDDAVRNYSYRRRGLYIDQFIHWMPVYDPRQLMVIRSEDFFVNPLETYEHVLDFLGLERVLPRSLKARNVGKYEKRNIPGRSELAAFYKPYNERLYAWLGRDMEW